MGQNWLYTQRALSNLKEQLKCSICNQLPSDPHILWCKHSYCKKCIEPLEKCPECNFFIVTQELVPNIILNQILSLMAATSNVILRDEPQCEISTEIDQLLNIKNKTSVTKSVQEPTILKTIENNSFIETKSACQDGSSNNAYGRSVVSKRNLRGRSPLHLHKKQMSSPISSPVNDSGIKNSKRRKSIQTPDSKKQLKIGHTPQSFKSTSKKTILHSAKKKIETDKLNKKGETPLHIACRQGKLKLVQQLLQEGAQPNVKDYANWTPLCDSVSLGKIDIVKALLEAGAAVNTPCHQNTTPLIEAVIRKNKPMVSLLMSYGADMNQRTSLDNTALSLANDELKDIMMNIKNVPVMEHPIVKVSPKVITVCNLPEDNFSMVKSFCEKFNLTLSTTFIDDTTHLVVHKTTANTCEGTTEVLLAILNGCSVVGVDWIAACVQAGDLVDVDHFEPSGTDDEPNSSAFFRARRNREQLLPKLFDGCHISLQHGQPWSLSVKEDLVTLVRASGAQYQPRECDPERIPLDEQTVMFHTSCDSMLSQLSHVILYQPMSEINHITYNMSHAKSLPVSWFKRCIKQFSVVV